MVFQMEADDRGVRVSGPPITLRTRHVTSHRWLAFGGLDLDVRPKSQAFSLLSDRGRGLPQRGGTNTAKTRERKREIIEKERKHEVTKRRFQITRAEGPGILGCR